MPLYDFKCRACDLEFEAFKGILARAPKCKCGGKTRVVFKKAPVVSFPGQAQAGFHDVVDHSDPMAIDPVLKGEGPAAETTVVGLNQDIKVRGH